MVYVKIDDGVKQRAIQLCNEGWDVEEVADVLGVSAKSIPRWQENYELQEHVRPSTVLQGQPCLFTAVIVEQIRQLIEDEPTLYLDEIALWLAINHDLPISPSTLSENLIRLGLTRKRVKRTAAQRDEALRTAWIHDTLATYTPEQMVFVDESSKDGRTLLRPYGRAESGMTPSVTTELARGDRYSILPALTLDGYLALRVVPGSVDGEEFYDFLLEDLIPKMHPFPGPASVLIMDNCATHKSDAVRLAIEAAGCILHFLPPYSPDLNPIEESFSCIKNHLKRNYRNFWHSETPETDLLEICMEAVTAGKAAGWFRDSGYM